MTDKNLRAYYAYIEGRNAARDGLLKEGCPYLPEDGYELIDNWECGFEDAWFEIFEETNV